MEALPYLLLVAVVSTGASLLTLFSGFGLGTLLLTMGLARRWSLPHPVFAGLLLLACPGVWQLTFSGLTEPLFALGLMAVVMLADRDHLRGAAGVAGLLPFVR